MGGGGRAAPRLGWKWAQKDGCAQRTGAHARPKATSYSILTEYPQIIPQCALSIVPELFVRWRWQTYSKLIRLAGQLKVMDGILGMQVHSVFLHFFVANGSRLMLFAILNTWYTVLGIPISYSTFILKKICCHCKLCSSYGFNPCTPPTLWRWRQTDESVMHLVHKNNTKCWKIPHLP